MRKTFNEIAGNLRKAAIGAGLPVGLAEDAGRAGVWLARHGHDGVAAVVAGIADGFETPPEPLSRQDGMVFDHARVGRIGPCALDLVMAGAAGDGVILSDVDAPWLMIGLAGYAADEQGAGFELAFSNGARVCVSPQGLEVSGQVPGRGCEIAISSRPVDADRGRAAGSDRGAEVDPEHWAQVEVLAARTYVPATEASRALGAGAGLTDND